MVSLRALKWLVAVMGVMILAGTVTLGVLIVQRFGGGLAGMAGSGGAGVVTLSLGQPAGSRIAGIAGAGERVAVWVVRPDGETRVLLIEPRRGRVLGEVRAGE